jgi:hypothetical protein
MILPLPKFTFINGPKESGKGTLAKLLRASDPNIFIESFAQPIRDALIATFWPEESICSSFNLTDTDVKKRDMPLPPRHPLTPNTIRDAMISFSEDWMKPRWGEDVFGKLALRRCQENEIFYSRFVFDDCGFTEEVNHIVKAAGAESCLILRLDRPGHSFVGDSRNYVNIPDVNLIPLLNDASPEDLLSKLQLALGVI